jgi:hypothetical protein
MNGDIFDPRQWLGLTLEQVLARLILLGWAPDVRFEVEPEPYSGRSEMRIRFNAAEYLTGVDISTERLKFETTSFNDDVGAYIVK